MTAIVWIVLAAQLEKPPEFSQPGGFKKSNVDAAIDSAAHTSGQKSESAKWFVRSLDEWTASSGKLENEAWLAARRTLSTGALAQAAGEFARASRQHPASVRFCVGHAAAHYAQGSYAKAAEILVAAPLDVRLAPYLAEVLDAHKGVLPRLAALARAHPASFEAQYFYGAALPGVVGASYLRTAAQLKPADARPPLALGRQAANAREAIGHLELAVKLDATNAQAHYLLGQAYQRAGDRERAAAAFARYRTLRP